MKNCIQANSNKVVLFSIQYHLIKFFSEQMKNYLYKFQQNFHQNYLLTKYFNFSKLSSKFLEYEQFYFQPAIFSTLNHKDRDNQLNLLPLKATFHFPSNQLCKPIQHIHVYYTMLFKLFLFNLSQLFQQLKYQYIFKKYIQQINLYSLQQQFVYYSFLKFIKVCIIQLSANHSINKILIFQAKYVLSVLFILIIQYILLLLLNHTLKLQLYNIISSFLYDLMYLTIQYASKAPFPNNLGLHRIQITFKLYLKQYLQQLFEFLHKIKGAVDKKQMPIIIYPLDTLQHSLNLCKFWFQVNNQIFFNFYFEEGFNVVDYFITIS